MEVLVTALQSFWWLWALLGAIVAVKLAWRLYQWRRLARAGIAEIDAMDGATFERCLVTLFQQLGYRAEHTGRAGDYGADLVVVKDGLRSAVQAKRATKNVGVGAVQEVGAAKPMYGCAAAIVVTNRGFTLQAQRLARANGVTLWDRDVLVAKLLDVRKSSKSETTVVSGAPIAEIERCVVCKVTVSEKVLEYCRTHSKRFSGNIYCFEHQRLVRPGA